MSIVVVGGQARKVGKTTVMAGIIASLPERRWTAVKITQCHHAEPGCHCELNGSGFLVTEEHRQDAATDSSRYLAAGAERAFWVRVKPDALEEAVHWLKQIVAQADNVIVESNSVARWLSAEVVFCVQGPPGVLSKGSYDDLLVRADALVVQETSPSLAVDVPVFFLSETNGELREWLEARLRAKEKAHRP